MGGGVEYGKRGVGRGGGGAQWASRPKLGMYTKNSFYKKNPVYGRH